MFLCFQVPFKSVLLYFMKKYFVFTNILPEITIHYHIGTFSKIKRSTIFSRHIASTKNCQIPCHAKFTTTYWKCIILFNIFSPPYWKCENQIQIGNLLFWKLPKNNFEMSCSKMIYYPPFFNFNSGFYKILSCGIM